MKILEYLYGKVSRCLTDIAIAAMKKKIEYYEEKIEKNNYCSKYAGFLPTTNFSLSMIKKLEAENNYDIEEVKNALDQAFDSFQSDESLDAYKNMDITKSGDLTISEVIVGFKLKESLLMRHVLSTFDLDKNHVFDTEEFKGLYGLLLEQEKEYVFRAFDVSNSGTINAKDVYKLYSIVTENRTTDEQSKKAKKRIQKKFQGNSQWDLKAFVKYFKRLEKEPNGVKPHETREGKKHKERSSGSLNDKRSRKSRNKKSRKSGRKTSRRSRDDESRSLSRRRSRSRK